MGAQKAEVVGTVAERTECDKLEAEVEVETHNEMVPDASRDADDETAHSDLEYADYVSFE